MKDTDELLTEIASGEGPVHKHRLRVLIYPQWVYKSHRAEIEQLIRSHSAARISCVPLVADRLYDALGHDEWDAVRELNKALQQTTIDKAPPRARYSDGISRCDYGLANAFVRVESDIPRFFGR